MKSRIKLPVYTDRAPPNALPEELRTMFFGQPFIHVIVQVFTYCSPISSGVHLDLQSPQQKANLSKPDNRIFNSSSALWSITKNIPPKLHLAKPPNSSSTSLSITRTFCSPTTQWPRYSAIHLQQLPNLLGILSCYEIRSDKVMRNMICVRLCNPKKVNITLDLDVSSIHS